MKKEGAIKNEEIVELKTQAQKLSEELSPDLNEMIRVKIDSSTYIYIDKDKDPDLARKKFIERLQSRSFSLKYKNYDTDTEL
jgi:hypothetical protein